MKTRKYKKHGGRETKKEEGNTDEGTDEKPDERTEEELIVVDLLESLIYNFKKYKHLFDLNNSTSGCPDKLLKIILGEIHDEDDNEKQENEKKKKKNKEMSTKAKKLTEQLTGKGASAPQPPASNLEIAVGADMLKAKGKEVLQDNMKNMMASQQAKEAAGKAEAAAGKAIGVATKFLNKTPTGMLANAVLEKGLGSDYKEEAERMAKRKAEELKEKAKEIAKEKVENINGGRKNRKKTRKNRFRKKKKSP